MSPRQELRLLTLDELEWRDGQADEWTLEGHAAVFNQLSGDLGGFREIIEPGFFRTALRKAPDVRALINHDPNLVLARTAAGTLELREDGTGLRVRARVAKTSYANDLRLGMQRGDVDQMSFAFSLAEDGDDWAIGEDGTIVRTLRADGADQLYDVSLATYPAYAGTDAAIRQLEGDLLTPDAVFHQARSRGLLAAEPRTDIETARRRARTTLAMHKAALGIAD
jgi:uncharacterized protein